jgi:hypothetical protein
MMIAAAQSDTPLFTLVSPALASAWQIKISEKNQ